MGGDGGIVERDDSGSQFKFLRLFASSKRGEAHGGYLHSV